MRTRLLLLAGMVAMGLGAAGCGGEIDASATDPRVQQGLAIAPVTPNMAGKDANQIGLGSYLVNAVGGCNDCHTAPAYASGGNPYLGQPVRVNTTNYLAGGACFGPFMSR